MERDEIRQLFISKVWDWVHRHPNMRYSLYWISQGMYRRKSESSSGVKCKVNVILTEDQKNDTDVQAALNEGRQHVGAHVTKVFQFTPEEWSVRLQANPFTDDCANIFI